MPHQCLKCEEIYDNASDVIIKGCPKCQGKLFLYIKKIPEQKSEIELSKHEKDIIIDELDNMVDIDNTERPIILKLENIRVLSPGKYEIDVNELMKKEKPLIYKVDEGTYYIDLNFLRGIKNE